MTDLDATHQCERRAYWRQRAETAEARVAELQDALRETERWKALIARNVRMMRELCDDPQQALDFIEGMVTDRIAMIVPPDMVPPEQMEEAIRRGRELAAQYGWAGNRHEAGAPPPGWGKLLDVMEQRGAVSSEGEASDA